MRLGTKGRHAVVAMIDIALHHATGPLSLAVLGRRQGMSLSFLEQMFTQLRRHGLVASTRGPGGGYSLARTAQQITVADILYAVDALAPCAASADDVARNARHPQRCEPPELWASLSERMVDFLDSVSLQKLVDDQRARGVQLHVELPRSIPTSMAARGPVKPQLPKVANSVFQLGSLAR